MKLCTAVQEGCGYKDTLRSRRYFAPSAKYFTVCITYQPPLVQRELYVFPADLLEGFGYKDTPRAHRYFAPSAKYFTVCIIYQPPLVEKVQ